MKRILLTAALFLCLAPAAHGYTVSDNHLCSWGNTSLAVRDAREVTGDDFRYILAGSYWNGRQRQHIIDCLAAFKSAGFTVQVSLVDRAAWAAIPRLAPLVDGWAPQNEAEFFLPKELWVGKTMPVPARTELHPKKVSYTVKTYESWKRIKGSKRYIAKRVRYYKRHRRDFQLRKYRRAHKSYFKVRRIRYVKKQKTVQETVTIPATTRPKDKADAYHENFVAGRDLIRHYDPTARVIWGEHSPAGRSMVYTSLERYGFDGANVATVHPYGGNPIGVMDEFVKKIGGRLPMAVTEWGVPSKRDTFHGTPATDTARVGLATFVYTWACQHNLRMAQWQLEPTKPQQRWDTAIFVNGKPEALATFIISFNRSHLGCTRRF